MRNLSLSLSWLLEYVLFKKVIRNHEEESIYYVEIFLWLLPVLPINWECEPSIARSKDCLPNFDLLNIWWNNLIENEGLNEQRRERESGRDTWNKFSGAILQFHVIVSKIDEVIEKAVIGLFGQRMSHIQDK